MSRLSEDCDEAFERERRRGSWAAGGYGTYHLRERQPADEYVRVLNIEKESEKAWQLHLSCGAVEWFPKSCCAVKPNGSGMLYLRCPAWLWKEKKLCVA